MDGYGRLIPVGPEILQKYDEAVKRFNEYKAQAKAKPAPRGGTLDPSTSVLLDLQALTERGFPSVVEPAFGVPQFPPDDDVLTQRVPVARSTYPRWSYGKGRKTSSVRNLEGMPIHRIMPCTSSR